MRSPPNDPRMPRIPQDEDGPVFNAPWEAHAFALCLTLHDEGHFTWREWVDGLSAEIRAAQQGGDPDLGDTYYLHWLGALEKILDGKGLISRREFAERKEEWAAADHSREFGQPLVRGEG